MLNDKIAKFMQDAPPEVAEATAKASAAFQRLRKAMTQVEAWKQEHSQAQRAHEVALAEQLDILNRWNPETGVIAPKGLAECPPTALASRSAG